MAGEPADGPSEPIPAPPTARDAVAILDFGSQYSQLIARRVREAHVYCELLPHDVTAGARRGAEPARLHPDRRPGQRLRAGRAADPRASCSTSGLPILGICYGMQLLAHQLGGEVAPELASASTARPRSTGATTPAGSSAGCRRASASG